MSDLKCLHITPYTVGNIPTAAGDKWQAHIVWDMAYNPSLVIYTISFIYVPVYLVHSPRSLAYYVPTIIAKKNWHGVYYLSIACATSYPVELSSTA